MQRIARTLVTTLLVPASLLAGGALGGADRAPSQTPAPTSFADGGWSVHLDVGRPYLAPGATLRGWFELFNGSSQDAYGFVPISGANGCSFSVTVLDAFGNVVWQPGSVVNGQYGGPGCTFGSTSIQLPAGGSSYRRAFSFPLVYQNPGGFGTQGAPLDPGAYKVRADVFFFGPNHTSAWQAASGLSYAVEVPVMVEP